MTQTTSADGAQGVAVLGLPELARALAEAGLCVVTGDNFRAAASAANAALKVAPVPMVMADVAVAGTSPWVEKVVRSCPVVFVGVDLAEGQKRVAGNTSAATRLPAPVSLDDVLAAVGVAPLGTGAQLLADGSVTAGSPAAVPAPPAPVDEFSFGVDAPLPTPAPLPPVPAVPVPAVDTTQVAAPAPAPQPVAAPVPAPQPVTPQAPPVPAFDFWGSSPAVPPVAPAVPAPVAVTAPVVEPVTPPAPVPAPAVDLRADDPTPLPTPAPLPPVTDTDPAPWAQQPALVPAPVEPDPAPWAPPPVDFPAPTHQFGVPDQPVAPPSPVEQFAVPAPLPAVEQYVAPVTPLPPVPQVPVPPMDAPLDRVPPTPVAPPAPTWQQQAVAAAPGQAPRPAVVVGEQIGVETGYSPTLGRQLAPCVFTLAGKGGVGKTSIALAIAQRAAVIGGLRTVLVDGNRGQGDLRTYLSLTRSGLPTIYDAVTTGDPAAAIVTPDRLNANRPDGAEELAIALVQAPPRGLTDPTTITSALYHDVITAARGMADLVVVDTQIVEGSERGMFDELTIPMLASHAYGVGIADLSRPGVDNLIAHLAEFIAQGVPVDRLMTMLNRVPATTEFDLQRTSDALSRYGAFLAAVPADPEVHSAMAYGTSIQDNPALAPVLDQILMRVTNNPVFAQSQYAAAAGPGGVAAPKKRGGLFRRGRG